MTTAYAEARVPEAPVAQEPQADAGPGDEEGQRGGQLGHRRFGASQGRQPERLDEIGAGEDVEPARHDGAVWMAAPRRDPGERDGLRGPGDGDRVGSELDRRGHRERRESGPDRQEAEQVGIAVTTDECEPDGEMGQRDQHQERAAIRDEVAVEQGEAGPDEEGGIGEHERRRRGAQVVAMAACLLPGRRNEVDQPEPHETDEPGDRRGISGDPAGELGRRKQERDDRQPRP